MNLDEFQKQYRELVDRVGSLQQGSEEPADDPARIADALAELSTALEELRVAEEQLREQNEELLEAHLELDAERERYHKQNARLRLLHEIDRAVLSARSLEDIAQAAVKRMRRLLGCDWVGALLCDEDGSEATWLAVDSHHPAQPSAGQRSAREACQISTDGDPRRALVVEEITALAGVPPLVAQLGGEGFRSCALAPLVVNERTMGVLCLADRQPKALRADAAGILRQVADSLAVALHNARLTDQLQWRQDQLAVLHSQMIEAQESERRSIARELHDQAAQSLTSLIVGLTMLERSRECTPCLAPRIQDLQQMAAGLAEELHELAVGLRPASLDHLGLLPALEQLVESFRNRGLTVHFLSQGLVRGARFAPAVEITLFRVVQETLTNVLRHAHTSTASVLLQRRAAELWAVVEDNGIGFDANQALPSGRLGLFSLRERVEMLGGSLTIESAVGSGTAVYVKLPGQRASSPSRA